MPVEKGPNIKKKKWFLWMKAYKLEHNRRHAVAALSATNPEFSLIDMEGGSDANESSMDTGRGRTKSDWARKEGHEGFLEDVVKDALTIEKSRSKAKNIVDEIVAVLKTIVPQSEAYYKSTQQVNFYLRIQSAISLVLAAVIVYMHSTGTNLVVVNQSYVSTAVVMIATAAVIAAGGGWLAGVRVSGLCSNRVSAQLRAVLEKSADVMALLRDAGSTSDKDSSRLEDGHDIDSFRLPLDQYGEPPASTFLVRSATYLSDKRKEPSKTALFKLIAVDLLDTPHAMQNIAARPENRVALARARGTGPAFTLVFNFMIPGPPFLSFAAYWDVDLAKVTADTPFGRIAQKFFFGDSDEYRNDRFKFIPKVVEGNFAIKMAVKDTPTLMGHKLQQYYHRTEHYFEIDCDLGSSSVARNVTGLVLGYARSLEIHMALVLEGRKEDELPEVIMGTCSADHVDVFNAMVME